MLFGRGYIVDYCIALFQKEAEEKAWRNYIATGIKYISENTANLKGGKYLSVKYEDLFKPVDNRSGKEIVEDVISKCGLGG